MKNFKIRIKFDVGNDIIHKIEMPVDMTVAEMTSELLEAADYLILKQPDGSETLINARHIVYINVAEDTDLA